MNQPKKKKEEPKKITLSNIGLILIGLGVLALMGILNYKTDNLEIKNISLSVPYVFMIVGLILVILDNLSPIGDIIKSIFNKKK